MTSACSDIYPKRDKNRSVWGVPAALMRDFNRDFRAYMFATLSFVNKLITCGENPVKM